jgi:hypothetical protein
MIVYVGIRDISDFNMIEIITMSFFVFSSIYGGPTTAIADNVSTSTDKFVSARIEEQATTSIPTNKELESKVKTFFKDDPILAEIARCESSFRQYDANGDVLRGKVNKGDVGVMQINEYYHADKAGQLGLDLETPEGNMAYAKYLYEHEGGQPWKASSDCWRSAMKSAPAEQIALAK